MPSLATIDAYHIARLRLQNLGLASSPYHSAEDVVGRLAAAQAQEFEPAKWSLGQRMQTSSTAEVQQAISEGRILRTHVLRPTWHFVRAEDIRWLLALTAPRVLAGNALRLKQLQLTEQDFLRSSRILADALSGGNHLTRPVLGALLQQGGIDTSGQRLPYLLMNAELNALICSGIPRANEQTYALMDERVKPTEQLSQDEALARLTRGYFISHGPATAGDFAAWSSLTARDIKHGLEMVLDDLEPLEYAGQTYWHSGVPLAEGGRTPRAFLLQGFDEYLLYSRTKSIINQAGLPGASMNELGTFRHALVIDTQVVARWRRLVKARKAIIEFQLLRPLKREEVKVVDEAVQRYSEFIAMPVEWRVVDT